MAIGETLAELIELTKLEMHSALAPSLGQNFRDVIKGRIKLEYKRLYHDFDWPHLETWEDKTVSAGQRYYDFPTTLSLETVKEVFVRWGGRWIPLSRGFGPGQYNSGDSDDNYRTDPAQCWRPYGDGQIEIWPLPASASTLRFVGKRAFNQLTSESDTADLDDTLISLYAAGKFLKRRGADDADLVLAEAASHYNTLKARANTGQTVFNLNSGGDEYDPNRREDRYLYAPIGGGGGGTQSDTLQIVMFEPSTLPGTPDNTLLVYNAGEAFTWSESECIATAETAATALVVISLTRNGVEVGTVTYAIGATTGVVDITTTAVSADDAIRLIAPASADATLAGVSITLVGST